MLKHPITLHLCFVRQSLNMEVEAPFKIVPYDFYCPSIQDALIERICEAKEVLCRIGADVEWMDVDDVDDVYNQLEAAPIIRDVPVADPLSEWVLSPWTENLT
ncbi:hypothetical protein ACJJTC_013465 [Scirpophaga incertulas]